MLLMQASIIILRRRRKSVDIVFARPKQPTVRTLFSREGRGSLPGWMDNMEEEEGKGRNKYTLAVSNTDYLHGMGLCL